ncbi:hypothetical protein GCM10010358_70770 [Streptomyces minutiscleroticus]|uniref:Uncharacterized protein n=1 Tax=Streptomyces minutiscleroticus TaxID=68238 RepID=A0A918NYL7_9ACTN|nr:hypothetical protein GCM10010358_70770 [Streptomyces minutiscleroticus]
MWISTAWRASTGNSLKETRERNTIRYLGQQGWTSGGAWWPAVQGDAYERAAGLAAYDGWALYVPAVSLWCGPVRAARCANGTRPGTHLPRCLLGPFSGRTGDPPLRRASSVVPSGAGQTRSW